MIGLLSELFAYLWDADPFGRVAGIVGAAMLAAASILVLIQLVIFVHDAFYAAKKALDPREPPVIEPRIAYKKAWLMNYGLRGVMGMNYGVDEEAEGPGFHAYKSFENALNHPQPGNVYLEVLLSGLITEHRLGYTASHQRVLQIITGSCASCERPATYYSITVTSGGERQPIFVCRKHAVVKSNRLSQRIIRSLIGSSSRIDYHKPMPELVNDFPKLKGSNIVVAAYDGEEAFTPTELPKTAETLVLTPSEVAR